jgi:hypothetical protein
MAGAVGLPETAVPVDFPLSSSSTGKPEENACLEAVGVDERIK